MTILDRYIARQYLINVVALFAILFSFIITVDVALNIDRFIGVAENLAEEANRSDSGFRRAAVVTILILDYWWPKLLQLFNFMLGLVLIGALGFTSSQLVRHRELVATMASGLSLWRLARPMLVAALGMCLVQLANQEFVMPRIAPLLTRDHGDAGKRRLGSDHVPLVADGQGNLFYARSFDYDAGVMQDLHVWRRNDEGLGTSIIRADTATWTDEGWRLDEGIEESRGPGDRSSHPIRLLETSLDPTALRMHRFVGFSQNLSFFQLTRMLDQPDMVDENMRSRIDRVRFGRFAIVLVNFLAIIIVLPFFMTREPRNMVVQSLKASPLSICSIVGGVLATSAAMPGIPAALGVFVPVIVLAPVALAMASSVKT